MVTPIERFYELVFDNPDSWHSFQLRAVQTGDTKADLEALHTEPRVVVLVPDQPEAWGGGRQWYAYVSETALRVAQAAGASAPIARTLRRDELPPGLRVFAGSPADAT